MKKRLNSLDKVDQNKTGNTLTQRAASSAAGSFNPLALAHSFQDALVVVNRQYQLVYFNKKAAELLALQKDAFMADAFQYVPEKRKQKIKAHAEKAFKGKYSTYEINSGTVEAPAWFQLTYAPVEEEDGKIDCIYVVIKNITEQKRIEKYNQGLAVYELMMHQSHQMFERFMENAPVIAWITSADGTLQYMNPPYLHLFNLQPSDMGKTIYDTFPKDIADDYMNNNLRVLKEGRAIDTVEEAVLPDGGKLIFKTFKFPLLIDKTSMVGGWAIDITEQVKLQEALSLSVERYNYANEATSDAIYDWDIPENKIEWNDGFESLFGYTEKTVSIRFWLSRVHSADLDKYKKTIINTLRGHRKSGTYKIEYRFLDARGNYRFVYDKAYLIKKDGKAVRVIGTLQDITEQKQQQEKLVLQEKKIKKALVRSIIETQERERRQLSVELHDNVNQMLASCKLMLEVARENKEAAAMLIEKSYQSIQAIINEVRKISHNLNPSAIEDVGLFDALKEMAEKLNLTGKLKVAIDFEEQQKRLRLKDEDNISIYRIIQEQINNILKHAHAQHVNIQLKLQLPEVSILIEDDGVGFNPEKIKKGLGLKNIQNRVEYYDGSLTIDSATGRGCTMRILLHIRS